jgi:hypothetical protein
MRAADLARMFPDACRYCLGGLERFAFDDGSALIVVTVGEPDERWMPRGPWAVFSREDYPSIRNAAGRFEHDGLKLALDALTHAGYGPFARKETHP